MLLRALGKISNKISLKIVGTGPMEPQILNEMKHLYGVELLGEQTKEQVRQLMKKARVLIFPSLCYEGLPMVIIEAFSVGLPVIASNLGSMSTLIDHNQTGLHFKPGDSDDLTVKIQWAWEHYDEMNQMGRNARAKYEASYSPEVNYNQLMSIYAEVLNEADINPEKNLSLNATK